MTELRRPGRIPWRRQLADLAAAIEWPATPPLASAVDAAIRTGHRARDGGGDPRAAPWCSASWRPC